MHLSVSLPAFVVAVLLISASPGPAMALILRRTALHGMRTAVPLILGLELGLYLWALAAAAGFAALVAASEAAYWALKIVGACVLVYLGVRPWLAAWRERRAGRTETARRGPRPRRPQGVRRGPGRAAGEPEGRGLHDRVLPAVRPEPRAAVPTTAVLALLQVCIELCFYFTLAAFVARAGAWFRRSTVRRRLEAVSGTVLVGLGLRVAASSR